MMTGGKGRYARLRDLPEDKLYRGLDQLGAQILEGDTSKVSTMAAYLDEMIVRLSLNGLDETIVRLLSGAETGL